MSPHPGAPAANPSAIREALWENEGGATLPPAHVAAAVAQPRPDRPAAGAEPAQPRMYADLMVEADRRRQAADDRRARRTSTDAKPAA